MKVSVYNFPVYKLHAYHRPIQYNSTGTKSDKKKQYTAEQYTYVEGSTDKVRPVDLASVTAPVEPGLLKTRL